MNPTEILKDKIGALGNVNTQSIAEIWNGDKMRFWRSFIKAQRKMPMCRRCDVAY